MELQNIILNMETDKVNPQTNEDIENTSPSWLLQQQQICFLCKIESLFLIRLKQQLQQSEERSQIKRKERKGQQVVCLFRASSCRLNDNPSGHICQNNFELVFCRDNQSSFLIRLQELQPSEENQAKSEERPKRASSCRLNDNTSGHICQNYFERVFCHDNQS